MTKYELIFALLMLFPANLIFLLSLYRSSNISELRASTGILYFLIFNSIYVALVLEYYFLDSDFEFKEKLIAAALVFISIAFLFKGRITRWLIKIFKLKD